MKPRILLLSELDGQPVGGKAAGLAELLALNLSVPPAFVIVHAQAGHYPDDLLEHYHRIGAGRVAVRSSALGEDGDEASFAGQYETVLNVEGLQALQAAIDRCVASLASRHATAYRGEQLGGASAGMNIVVQRMVQPRAAGVLFTADPVTARRDRLVIDAVRGLGEQLVSGEVTPDHYVLASDGHLVEQEWAGDAAILSVTEIAALVEGARQAAAARQAELDMEWAIDAEGRLHWLQARPITTLPADLNEFDTPVDYPDDVWTRCNIGEMMPGAVSPLTLSVSGRGIDHGMQYMQKAYGIVRQIVEHRLHIKNAFGHFFINLSATAPAASRVMGVDLQQMALAICGRELPELVAPRKAFGLIRVINFFRVLVFVFAIPRVITRFEAKLAAFRIADKADSLSQLDEIEAKFPFFLEAYDVHLQSSSGSGFTEGILQRMISAGAKATAEDQAEVARLLQGAEGVESAILVQMLDAVIDAIAAHPDAPVRFQQAETEAAYDWLLHTSGARQTYEAFLQRHGHRGYRELAMEDRCWADDPLPLVRTMQASIAARFASPARPKPVAPDTAELSRGVRWFLPKAHAAVRRREQTKSHLAKVSTLFKRAYRRVGELLVQEGHLPELNLVYFFSREELHRFVRRPDDAMVSKARLRQAALPYQQRLEFPDVVVGKPEPVVLKAQGLSEDGVLAGRPVSCGVVEGVARVARSPEEAAALQPGEILIAPITDVGWTPYFSLIAGLATDVGSAVSHGCVIAREYGLPAVVNLRTGTLDFQTGDRVRLDGDRGTLTLLERPEAQA